MNVKLFMCGGEIPISQYPLGIGYLLGNIMGDHKVSVVTDPKDLSGCDIIGLSSTASGIKQAIDILLSTSVPVIIGGQSSLWDKLSLYNFKHIVIGEGENSFNNILNESINEKIIHGNIVDNIDNIKYPILGKCKHWIPIITARGCPFKCKFCSSQKYWGKVRMHSPEYMAEYLKKLSLTYPESNGIYIMDDLFAMNHNRLASLHKIWIANKFHKRFVSRGFIRSSTFTLEMCKMMKEMGFKTIRFGAESGSNTVLQRIGKSATVEDHQRTIDIANQVNIPVTASFMYNTPMESDLEKKETSDFISRNKGKFLVEGYYKYMPFPGTDFYNGEDPLQLSMKVR